MKKIILFSLFLALSSSPVWAAELCQEFDGNMNIITVDCQTGKRVITAKEKERMAQKIRAEEERKAQEKQKELERAIEKRKQELAKKRQSSISGKRVLIDGKYYYLSEEPARGGKSSGGIRAGDWLFSVYGGSGAYTKGEVGIEYREEYNEYLKWSAGVSGLYFINSYFGAGLGIDWDRDKSGISLTKLSLLGRLNLNPHYPARLYLPFGVGYGRVEEKGIYWSGGRGLVSYEEKSNEVVYFVGLGLEFDLTERVSMGIEGRYNCFKFRSTDFAYLNGLLKLNIKL